MLYPPELRAHSMRLVFVAHDSQRSCARAPHVLSSACRPAKALDHTTVADLSHRARSHDLGNFSRWTRFRTPVFNRSKGSS
jgi:hypothetical protein